MPIDASIPLQVQQPNPANRISGFLDLGLKKNALDTSDATMAARIAQARAESQRAQTEADVSQRTADPRVSAAQSQAGIGKAQLSSQELQTARDHIGYSSQQLQNLLTKKDLTRKDVAQSITESLNYMNAPSEAYSGAFQGMPKPGASQEELRQFVLQSLNRAQGITAQLDRLAPQPAMVNNGQQMVPVAPTNPALTGQQQEPVQMHVPPTATTMGPDGQPTYVGAQPQQQGPIPSGPAIGQEAGIVGPTNVNNKHYETVSAEAQAAPIRISALQTILQEAPNATLSGGDWRRKFWQTVGSVFGTDTQASNDVIAKNVAMLAAQGGNTDAARAINEMATPNGKMSLKGIQETGQALIGIEMMRQAAGRFYGGIPTNSPDYQSRRKVWDSNADPKIWQVMSMTPEEQAEWRKHVPAGVRAVILKKAEALEKAGVSFGE